MYSGSNDTNLLTYIRACMRMYSTYTSFWMLERDLYIEILNIVQNLCALKALYVRVYVKESLTPVQQHTAIDCHTLLSGWLTFVFYKVHALSHDMRALFIIHLLSLDVNVECVEQQQKNVRIENNKITYIQTRPGNMHKTLALQSAHSPIALTMTTTMRRYHQSQS